jgi:hypothetical protein
MTRIYMEGFGFLRYSHTDDLSQLENKIRKFLLEKEKD